MIQLQNIYKVFNKGKPNEKTALNNINLTIDDGEFVAIMGKSGAGKSTLLNILGLLDKPSSGKYFLENQEISCLKSSDLSKLRNQKFGIVTQNPFMIDEITALENVIIPLLVNKTKYLKSLEIGTQALIDVGLKEQIKQKFYTLSGGEQQRVSIARAIVNNQNIILADEPTGSLDKTNAENVMKILTKINNYGKTVIIITHDIDVANKCNRVICLDEGKIISDRIKANEV